MKNKQLALALALAMSMQNATLAVLAQADQMQWIEEGHEPGVNYYPGEPAGQTTSNQTASQVAKPGAQSADARPANKPAVNKQNTSPKTQSGIAGNATEAAATSSAGTPGTSGTVLKGEVSLCVPKGTGMKLKLATVPSNGMRLLDKDMDGNFLPAHVGDVISARTTEDIYVEDNKVIPMGTIFKGKVSCVRPPRRVQRPGWLEISFDQLNLPDGRRFAFNAQADNFKQSTIKSKARGVGMVAANAAGGAIVGALVAYQLFGMRGTAATHGYNIAGGAAGGALLAAGHAIMKKGRSAYLEPGDDLNLSIDTDLLMPALTEPTKKVASNNLEGLTIKVNKSKTVRDGLGGSFLRLDVDIVNNSNRTLSSIDLFARDSNGNKYSVSMGPEDDYGFNFTLAPYEEKSTRLYFNSEYPKLGHELIWIDRNSRKVCFRQKLN